MQGKNSIQGKKVIRQGLIPPLYPTNHSFIYPSKKSFVDQTADITIENTICLSKNNLRSTSLQKKADWSNSIFTPKKSSINYLSKKTLINSIPKNLRLTKPSPSHLPSLKIFDRPTLSSILPKNLWLTKPSPFHLPSPQIFDRPNPLIHPPQKSSIDKPFHSSSPKIFDRPNPLIHPPQKSSIGQTFTLSSTLSSDQLTHNPKLINSITMSQQIKCPTCPNTLCQGERVICGPCFQIAAPSHTSEARDTTTQQRPPSSKVLAAVKHVRQINTPQCLPTGDHWYQQITSKALRDNNRIIIGKKRTQNGYGAAAKPPPFHKPGISSASHLGGTSVSLGFHILFGSTFRPLASNPQQQFRALLAVDLTHYNLADCIIKKALLQWPPVSPNPPESHYPRPPSEYNWDEDLRNRFFKLGKVQPGTSKNKIISVFGDPNLEEQNELIRTSLFNYCGRAGDCPLEVVFDADCFYEHHPEMTRPIIPDSSIPSGTPRKRKRKEILTPSEIGLDDDDSLAEVHELFASKNKNTRQQKTTKTPTGHVDPRPSEPIASTSKLGLPSFPPPLDSTVRPQKFRKHRHQISGHASSSVIHLDVDETERPSKNTALIEETYVLPGRESSEHSVNFHLSQVLNALLFQTRHFLPISTSIYQNLGSRLLMPHDQGFNQSTHLRFLLQGREDHLKFVKDQMIQYGSTIGTGSK